MVGVVAVRRRPRGRDREPHVGDLADGRGEARLGAATDRGTTAPCRSRRSPRTDGRGAAARAGLVDAGDQQPACRLSSRRTSTRLTPALVERDGLRAERPVPDPDPRRAVLRQIGDVLTRPGETATEPAKPGRSPAAVGVPSTGESSHRASWSTARRTTRTDSVAAALAAGTTVTAEARRAPREEERHGRRKQDDDQRRQNETRVTSDGPVHDFPLS